MSKALRAAIAALLALGLYLAPRFEGYGDTEDTVWFRDTRGNHHYPAQVLAWAVIPPLEVEE